MAATVLVTGVTGFIGSRVALEVLQAGYRARLSIRHPEQAEKLRRIFSRHLTKTEFTVVSDITATGCFDEALQDVQYVIHVASPLPDRNSDLLIPAMQGTTSILQSASKYSTVRKVVVTSSISSFIPLAGQPHGTVITEDTGVPYDAKQGISPLLDPMVQYRASKVASYQAIIDFVQEHKPSFDVTTFHPSWVYGRNPVQEPHDNLSGSCGALVLTLLSPERPINGQFLGVHVDDVAAAHVKALGESTRGFQSFLLSAPRRSWEEVNAFVRHDYPSVAWRLIPEDWMNYAVDSSKAEKELGLKFKSMEDQVRDTVDQQLEFGKLPVQSVL
ncbi:NAD(P)-binding protein [Aspergillus phoenicis ATCC 13157]|uniref:NAD(P)-binding protein n=1 Tax=Aspergillus phoenicis ATCC 13157 TaxID=1353007 RepID=A0A370P5E3_ASPPH|nr:NAD(P)-binding protein [Aspergillus phoenicis ATCC 13157]